MKAIITLAAALVLSQGAFAQALPTATTAAKPAASRLGGLLKPKAKAPTTTATSTPKAANNNSKPRTAASLECSKQADAKGLHGKAREAFRNQCKKAAK